MFDLWFLYIATCLLKSALIIYFPFPLWFFIQDNVIFERLTKASHYKDLTVAHLEQFATEGETKVGRIKKVKSVFFSFYN